MTATLHKKQSLADNKPMDGLPAHRYGIEPCGAAPQGEGIEGIAKGG
jgi:hypothetical protein